MGVVGHPQDVAGLVSQEERIRATRDALVAAGDDMKKRTEIIRECGRQIKDNEPPFDRATPELFRFGVELERKAPRLRAHDWTGLPKENARIAYLRELKPFLREVWLKSQSLDHAAALVPPGSPHVRNSAVDVVIGGVAFLRHMYGSSEEGGFIEKAERNAYLRAAVASPDVEERRLAMERIFAREYFSILPSFLDSVYDKDFPKALDDLEASLKFVESYRQRADGSCPLTTDIAHAADGLLDRLVAWGEGQADGMQRCAEERASSPLKYDRDAASSMFAQKGILGEFLAPWREKCRAGAQEIPSETPAEPQHPAWIGAPPPILDMNDRLWMVARVPEEFLGPFLKDLTGGWGAPDANDETRLYCLEQVRTVLNAEPDRLHAVPELLATVAGMAASVPLATPEERGSSVAAGLAWLLDRMVEMADPAQVVGHLVPLGSLDEKGEGEKRVRAIAGTLDAFSRAYGGSARLSECAHKLLVAACARLAITGNDAARAGINGTLEALAIILPRGIRSAKDMAKDMAKRGGEEERLARLEKAPIAQHMAVSWAERYTAYEAPADELAREAALGTSAALLERQRKVRANATNLLQRAQEARRVWEEFAASLARPSAAGESPGAGRPAQRGGKPQFQGAVHN